VTLNADARAERGEPVTAAERSDELPLGLDWAAFSARRFPNGRRHDFDAIAAYFAYREPPATAEHEGGVEAWEDEGGSTPSLTVLAS